MEKLKEIWSVRPLRILIVTIVCFAALLLNDYFKHELIFSLGNISLKLFLSLFVGFMLSFSTQKLPKSK